MNPAIDIFTASCLARPKFSPARGLQDITPALAGFGFVAHTNSAELEQRRGALSVPLALRGCHIADLAGASDPAEIFAELHALHAAFRWVRDAIDLHDIQAGPVTVWTSSMNAFAFIGAIAGVHIRCPTGPLREAKTQTISALRWAQKRTAPASTELKLIGAGDTSFHLPAALARIAAQEAIEAREARDRTLRAVREHEAQSQIDEIERSQLPHARRRT